MIQKSFLEKIKLYEWLVERSHSSNDLNKKGIYALYIQLPTVKLNKLIPVYIGQSKNKNGIGERFKQHKIQLSKLLKMSPLDYEEHIESGKQDGKHFYSKLHDFVRNINGSINDIKIKLLEEFVEHPNCNVKKCQCLDEKEQWWINEFKVEYFGFNQLAFVINWHKLVNSLRNNYYDKLVSKKFINDTKALGQKVIANHNDEYLQYGYYDFNFTNFKKFYVCFERYVQNDNWKWITTFEQLNEALKQE
ncbi:hypothetical protein [Spiroplasma endosymbiont of Dilophus febrilis]|uniref:hypothetical protein n=1 Tax=Spiroplasma endosymbiont of Dilophus febrilis TaxID=3066292 RepID=UPI00313DDE93